MFPDACGKRYKERKQTESRQWDVYLIVSKGLSGKAEVVNQARETLDFSEAPLLRELRMAQDGSAEQRVESAMEALGEDGLVALEDPFNATAEGRKRVAHILGRRRHSLAH